MYKNFFIVLRYFKRYKIIRKIHHSAMKIIPTNVLLKVVIVKYSIVPANVLLLDIEGHAYNEKDISDHTFICHIFEINITIKIVLHIAT